MISRSEIVPYGVTLTEAQDANVAKLLRTMNIIRTEYGLPMRITSGFRTNDDESRIDPAHPNSLHIQGAAIDILDIDGRLWNWCIDNLDLLTELGVWLEARAYTPTHVHFQIWPPKSGSRIFIP